MATHKWSSSVRSSLGSFRVRAQEHARKAAGQIERVQGHDDSARSEELVAEVEALRAEVRRLSNRLQNSETSEGDFGPYFVGGTGRSGTWTIGRMIGAHPDIAYIRREVRFHALPRGFRSVLDGTATPQDFARSVRYGYTARTGPYRDLPCVVGGDHLELAEAKLLALARDDLPTALASYAHAILDPFVGCSSARTWVETSPDNAAATTALHTVFPHAKVIHTVRDGRDVAASVVTMDWGPNDYDEALAWWAERLRTAELGSGSADSKRLHIVQFESLVHTNRQREIERMREFLGIDTWDSIGDYFERELTPERAHVGRWRAEVGDALADEIDEKYRDLYSELETVGMRCLPLPPDQVDDIAARG